MTDFSAPGIVLVTWARFVRADDSTPTRSSERFDLSRPGVTIDVARDLAKRLTADERVTYVVAEVQNWHAEAISRHKWTRAKGWSTEQH